MPHSNKKQRRELKRKAKKRDLRKQSGISPVKRLAAASGEVECWISDKFEELGQRQIFVYKSAAGLTGLSCFLVDRGVVGLKDAWTTMNIDRADLADALNSGADRGIVMRHGELSEALRCVCGGARWAHDNGMRLPKDWLRSALLLGNVSDWLSADVSGFVMEFAGHPEDLRQRLIGEPLDTYLQRDDIQFIFADDAPYMEQSTGRYVDVNGELDEDDLDEVDEVCDAIEQTVPRETLDALTNRLTPAAIALASRTADWLKAHQDMPSAELFEAWRSMMLATLLSKVAMPEAAEEVVADLSSELLKSFANRIEPSRDREYDRAVKQALLHVRSDAQIVERTLLEQGLTDGLSG